VAEGEARGGVGAGGDVGSGVLPGVDEEAVEAAEGGEEERCGEKREAKVGAAGYGGDEGRGGEEDADGDLFGQAVGGSSGDEAGGDVDEDEVTGEQDSQDEVEVDGLGGEAGKKDCEGDGGEDDAGEEGGAMTVVEVMAGFEVFFGRVAGVEEAGVQEAVGGVEHPDGDGHGEGGGEGETDVVGGGDEPGPESGDGGGVEGEEMPEAQEGLSVRGVVGGFGWWCGLVGRGCHLFILGLG